MRSRYSGANLVSFWRRMRRCASRAFGVGASMAGSLAPSMDSIVLYRDPRNSRYRMSLRRAGALQIYISCHAHAAQFVDTSAKGGSCLRGVVVAVRFAPTVRDLISRSCRG